MLGYLAVFLTGGFAGTVTLALVVAVRERQPQRTEETWTASHAQGPGNWAIADNGAITTESRYGTFTMAGPPARSPRSRHETAPSSQGNRLVLPPKQ